jgi:hypothetical protein
MQRPTAVGLQASNTMLSLPFTALRPSLTPCSIPANSFCNICTFAHAYRWWACKPAATTSSTAAALVIAATSGEVSAAAATAATALRQQLVDILVLDVPDRASVNGAVFATLTLNRQGLPVGRARLYVQVTSTIRGKSRTTTLPGVTKRDGTVKVAIPARARGVAGSRSIVEAFTIEARAQGAKGGVPVLSARKRVTWTA